MGKDDCKRGFGEILMPTWCEECKKDNIYKRYCDRLRQDIKEAAGPLKPPAQRK